MCECVRPLDAARRSMEEMAEYPPRQSTQIIFTWIMYVLKAWSNVRNFVIDLVETWIKGIQLFIH